jgi:predicted metalloendopeptidase
MHRTALLATALAFCPAAAAVAQAADDRTMPGLESGVDPNIQPGDDFFAWANADWLNATAIPAGRERWGARNEIEELTRRQIAQLLDDAGTAPTGSLARRVADFRAAYLNQAAIEARGLEPLKPLLDSIERLQDKAALTRLLASGLGADVDPLYLGVYQSSHLLGLSVERGTHGEKSNLAFLLQGGLGLPDRESYVSSDSGMQAVRTAYQGYISHLLALAGFDRADQRAQAVMALETALARSQATREASASDQNAGNRWTRADFTRMAPGMDWSAFLAAAGLASRDTIVAWQPGALAGLAALVGSEPLENWQDYLRFHALDAVADVLPRSFAEASWSMHGTAVPGQSQESSRARRAFEATQTALSEALGRLYSERYFPAAQKARVQAIVANVVAAFRRRVQAVTWMSPATRAVALAKLQTLYVGIGYPEHWQDYDDLVIDPTDPVGNLRRVSDRNYRLAIARLTQPIEPARWWIAPQTVGAVLVFEQNSYDFSAALLQPPKYDSTASDAAAYGAIGAIIGHDVSHFVDALGANYDAKGLAHNWWTAEDSSRYMASAAALVNQASGYRPFPDLGVNGKLTLTENLADLGGLLAAFDAYRRTLGTRARDKAYVRQQDRQFFIAFARSWRSRISEAALRTQLTSNDHPPETYRVSTVRNLDAWYEAFDVKPGQRLYVEPGARVRIW